MKLAAPLKGVPPVYYGAWLLVACFLLSLIYLSATNSDALSFSFLGSQMSYSVTAPASSTASSNQQFVLSWFTVLGICSAGTREKEGIERSSPCDLTFNYCEVDDRAVLDRSRETAESLNNNNASTTVDQLQRSPTTKAEMSDRSPLCDLSNYRSDTCEIKGDARVAGKDSPSVVAVLPGGSSVQSWKIKPYARKSDPTAMRNVRQIDVRAVVDHIAAVPRCDVTHTAPAVVFSTGGYLGNYFHDFTDVLVPLFQTAGPFAGEVQLVVADFKFWWVGKYLPYFNRISRYPIIDFDRDERVHCFRHVLVGLRSSRDLIIDPASSPARYTMLDFTKFMREAYSLDRDHAGGARGRRNPRLLVISRARTRKFMNVDEIARLARKVGFEVVVAEADFGGVANFSRLVNSCDAMLGVHGAGLTNAVFLPTNAVLIQVVPFGKLEWIAANYFRNPAREMRLRYLEYTIGAEESTLTELYSRDDPVFRDPESIHKLGWFTMGAIYLDKQNVRLDLRRFRPVLSRALKLLRN
ncbi:hypothetical protein ZIOFF_066269 [Zingiber officinale]|uniref:Glycosyltransferase 61 catalytic domain-containing protein n=1 Tax=Zingiber officinale TaxID=94328 RepID=A0A8J5EYG0_ZINOF|nr:hypothetical protein ZIOFF_066269 [Zingiber officinale]